MAANILIVDFYLRFNLNYLKKQVREGLKSTSQYLIEQPIENKWDHFRTMFLLAKLMKIILSPIGYVLILA